MRRLRYVNGGIDETDAAILSALIEDGRMAMKDLAGRVGLSGPSVSERVRRLEECGIIEGYGAKIDPQALGFSLAAYIRVQPLPGELKHVGELLTAMAEVIECDRVTGDDCYIAKVVIPSVRELTQLIDQLAPFAKTNSSIINASPIRRRMPPIMPANRGSVR